MDIIQRSEMLTTAYIHSYNLALKEIRNPNLAAQIAAAVVMVINMNAPKQQVLNPLDLLFAHMAATAQKKDEKKESEVDNHDRTENESN